MKRILLISPCVLSIATGQIVAQQADTLRVRQLQEVSVVGTRAKRTTPMSYSNIDKNTLRKVNLGQDVPYLLQMQPSVVATSDAGTGLGYTGIRVRGVDATGTNVTANGVPINDSESQAVFWVNMPDLTSSVEEMQLQRGIGTSSNGAGSFGASLNLRTSNLSTKAYGEIGLSGGSFSTLRKNIKLGTGTLSGHWAADVRLSQIESQGYIDRASVDLSSYFVQVGYFSGQSLLKFITFGGKEVTGIAWRGITAQQEALYGRRYNSSGDMYENGKSYYHNTDNYRQQHNHLIFTQGFGSKLSLNITAHYTKGFGYTEEYRTGRKPSEYGLARYNSNSGKEIKRSLIRRKYLDNDFVGLISNLHYKHRAWELTTGISANHYKGIHYGELPWIERSFPDEVQPKERYYEGVGKKLDISSYIKASLKINHSLSTYLDLQYRHIDYRLEGTHDGYSQHLKGLQRLDIDKHFDFLNPKAGLYWQFSPRSYAYASLALAHREPNRKMYTSIGVKGELPKAEQMFDYELGYGYKGRQLQLSANVYYMQYKDQLVMTGKLSDVGDVLLENVPDSYRLGVEITSVYGPHPSLKLEGSLALSQNRIKHYTYYIDKIAFDAKNTPIAYSPGIVASATITYKGIRHTELSLRAQHVGKQYLDNSHSEVRTMPAYTVVGLQVGYQIPTRGFIKDWLLSLQINNLLNSKYHSNAFAETWFDNGTEVNQIKTFPQAGIHFLVGTTIRF